MFPKGDYVEHDCHHSRPLHDLHQPQRAEIAEQSADDDRGNAHAHQEHHIKQRHNAGPRLIARPVRGQRQTRRLRHVHAKTREQKGKGRPNFTGPCRPGDLIARQHQKTHRHNCEAAKLPKRAEPQIGDPLPPDRRTISVGAKAQERAERGHQNGDRDHDCDDPRHHAQFDNHYAVERAQKQDRSHPNADLEQRQAQQLRKRQLSADRVREGQHAQAQSLYQMLFAHGRNSNALEM